MTVKKKKKVTKAKAPAKKATARKTVAKKAPAKKTVAKKAPARKTAAKKTTAKKAPVRKTAAKKTTAKKAPARKTAAKKAPVRKAAAKKTTAKKAPARKTATKKAPVRKVAAKKAAPKVARKAAPSVRDVYSKSQLFTTISECSGVAKKDVSAVFDVFYEIVEQHVKRRGPQIFTLPGLAKIKVVNKPATKARKGVNPFTGEPTVFKAKPARNVVKVLALKKLKDMAK